MRYDLYFRGRVFRPPDDGNVTRETPPVRLGLWIAALVAGACLCADARAATPLLEFDHAGATYQGRLFAQDEKGFWLLGRDGRLDGLEFSKVTGYRQAAPRFERLSAATLRDRLREEFARSYDVAGTEHYLVVAPPGRARPYAELFEDVYRTFYLYFLTRGLKPAPPEFPLVAVVYADRQSFVAARRSENLPTPPNLIGSYHPLSNRVLLYEDPHRGDSAASDRFRRVVPLPSARFKFAPVPADLQGTLIHEATHQVAFNTGVHARLGDNPRWVVEGLATVFESPGVRDNARAFSPKTRINRERFVHFANFAAGRNARRSLAAFVESDRLFDQAPLDAYSQAWALTFFLIESRPVEYARFLKALAERNPLDHYPAEERTADFRRAFGNDLDWLEVELLRFMDGLK